MAFLDASINFISIFALSKRLLNMLTKITQNVFYFHGIVSGFFFFKHRYLPSLSETLDCPIQLWL